LREMIREREREKLHPWRVITASSTFPPVFDRWNYGI